MTLWKPGQLSSKELAAIRIAAPEDGDQFVKISDIPAGQLTSDELAAIQAANLADGDIVAKISDIDNYTGVIPVEGVYVESGYPWMKFYNTSFIGGFMNQSIFAQSGDSIILPFYISEDGYYELWMYYGRNTDKGIVSIYLDETLKMTKDLYGTELNNLPCHCFSQISRGWHYLKIKTDSKNGASSGYAALISDIFFRKINNYFSFHWTHGTSLVSNPNKKMTSSIDVGNPLQRNPDASMRPTAEYWLQHAPALNDEFSSPSILLLAGNYELGMTVLKSSNEGIITIFENENEIGTYDFYAASPTYNVIPTFAFSIDETRDSIFSFKVTSKNPSSSNYYIAVNNFYVKRLNS